MILISALDDWESYLAVVRAGAFDYIEFPPDRLELERILGAALKQKEIA